VPLLRPNSRRPKRIELNTPIVPRAIMEAVCEEAGQWLGHPLPRRWIRELTCRANTIYANNPRFRRKIHARDEQGRDYLWSFARHWLAGLILKQRPHDYTRLPASFSIGQPLPVRAAIPSERPKAPARISPPIHRRTPSASARHSAFAAMHFSFP
jgi:hypothetical protein